MTEVFEVSSQRDLNNFLKLPFTIYKQDPFYVPPLLRELKKHLSDKNPFFHHAIVNYFLAKQDEKIQGRIISIINQRHIELHSEKVGFFGFFESINNKEVAFALLDKVSETLKKMGMHLIRGPMNFSTNEECGFLIEGFNQSPMLMTPYNPPYYNELMEQYHMEKAKDLYAYIVDVPEYLPEKIIKAAQIAEKKLIHVRLLNKKRFHQEMNAFKEVYNSAWNKNWGFIPLSDEEIIYLGHKLKDIVIPELTLIAEKNGEPVGFLGLLPDYNYVLKYMKGKMNPISIIKALYYSRKIKDLRMLLLGIKAEYRNRGVDALLFREAFKGVKKGGYRRVEFSWILEDNLPVQRLVEMIGGRLYKKYRIYEKRLL